MNLIKFTPPNGRVINQIGQSNDNSGLFLETRNTRICIPSEEIDHVINPFYQVDDVLTRSNEGIRPGLALVKFMVDVHNATTNIGSERNKGTTDSTEFFDQRSVPVIKMPNESCSF